MFPLPDDIGFLLSTPLAGLVVPCSDFKSTFVPLSLQSPGSFRKIEVFLKATITIERRTTQAAKQVLASLLGTGLITHFTPVSKVLQREQKDFSTRTDPLQK